MMSLVKEIQTTKFQIIQRYSHNYIILGIKTLRHLCRMFQDVSQFVWKKTPFAHKHSGSWAWLVGVACSTVAYPEILLFEIIWRSIWMKWNYPRCRATENMQWLADVEPMLKDWTIKEPYHDDCCINLHLLTKLDFGLISTSTRLGESWHLHGFQIAGGHAIIYLFQCMSDSELLSQNFSHNLSICKEIERFALTLDQAQWEFMGVLSSTAILHCYFCLVEAACVKLLQVQVCSVQYRGGSKCPSRGPVLSICFLGYQCSIWIQLRWWDYQNCEACVFVCRMLGLMCFQRRSAWPLGFWKVFLANRS